MGNGSKPSDMLDDEVLTRVGSGETEYFSVLYERYVGKIYNYIYYRTGNQFEAEDLTERVFYRALGHIHSYKNKGVPFSAWLYRIAHNLVANWHRDNSRRHEVPLEDFNQPHLRSEHPESSLIISMENESLIKTLQKLPAERQQLIILKFVEDLSNAEIAIIMGRSEGAIKSLYHRTLMSLRKDSPEED
ncbi:MAG: sigma-70 family RNA polymerase sigma factor [Anaerolineae bacterium]|nr:sigma-70 family RNA polymerase sigma factor [Anaerolineae bacterium]